MSNWRAAPDDSNSNIVLESDMSLSLTESARVTLPACVGGVVQLTEVEEAQKAGTRLFGAVPNLHMMPCALGIFDPVTVTRVPPWSRPDEGETMLIDAASS
jgi:hypothetical protein